MPRFYDKVEVDDSYPCYVPYNFEAHVKSIGKIVKRIGIRPIGDIDITTEYIVSTLKGDVGRKIKYAHISFEAEEGELDIPFMDWWDKHYKIFTDSSNGRKADFESVNSGSSPESVTKK